MSRSRNKRAVERRAGAATLRSSEPLLRDGLDVEISGDDLHALAEVAEFPRFVAKTLLRGELSQIDICCMSKSYFRDKAFADN